MQIQQCFCPQVENWLFWVHKATADLSICAELPGGISSIIAQLITQLSREEYPILTSFPICLTPTEFRFLLPLLTIMAFWCCSHFDFNPATGDVITIGYVNNSKNKQVFWWMSSFYLHSSLLNGVLSENFAWNAPEFVSVPLSTFSCVCCITGNVSTLTIFITARDQPQSKTLGFELTDVVKMPSPYAPGLSVIIGHNRAIQCQWTILLARNCNREIYDRK